MLDYPTQLMNQLISIEKIESASRILKLKEAK